MGGARGGGGFGAGCAAFELHADRPDGDLHLHDGGQDSFTVPAGVSSVDVIAVGAAGGAGLGGGGGGEGASVEDMAVPVGG